MGFNYTHPITKKRKNIGLGNYPGCTLKIAREKAQSYRELLSQGHDPKEHKDQTLAEAQKKEATTLQVVAQDWIKVKANDISEKHQQQTMRSLQLHVFPVLGNTPIHKMNAKDTIQYLNPIAAKGSLETVKRLTQRINEIMTYACNVGLIEHNPLSGISKAFQTPKKQHQPSLSPDELPRFMRALAFAHIKLVSRCLIQWQLHTMVRPSEAAGTRWKEIDMKQALWTIPAERMKKKVSISYP